jgi:hypothetical protein
MEKLVQTFLPSDDFALCAMTLDRQRLGKQRVETLQIMQTIAGMSRGKGWINHPATKMWIGHEEYLMLYQIAIVSEWTMRGYKDTCLDKTYDAFKTIDAEFSYPEWMGNDHFHASHRSNLLRKNVDFYSKFGWTEPDDLEYIWPV